MHSGKVRELYADGDDLVMVASDRVSIYDVILPTLIPDKGKILTQLSLWWFDQLAGIAPNHVVSATDVPAEWAGRAIRVRKLRMLPVESIARGYLAGLGLESYRAGGSVSGVRLPAGLTEGSKLPEPVYTPTTKAEQGHDEPMTFQQVADLVSPETAASLRDLTLEVYRRGAELAAERGVIIADTKLEWGRGADGDLVLADEVLTPDSSRFWPAESWEPGRSQVSFDKQFVRDWLTSPESGWDPDSGEPPPPLPAAVVEQTRRTYVAAYERITGMRWN